jgi:hypothetical protein
MTSGATATNARAAINLRSIRLHERALDSQSTWSRDRAARAPRSPRLCDRIALDPRSDRSRGFGATCATIGVSLSWLAPIPGLRHHVARDRAANDAASMERATEPADESE